MKRLLLLAPLALTACFESAPAPQPPPAPPPPPPFSLSISPSAPWSLIGSKNVSWSGAGFDFPVCPASEACGPGYVEYPMQANISTAGGITIVFQISGTDPVFDPHTEPSNTCPGPATLSLLLRRSGATINNDRWYSSGSVPLALGPASLSVTLHSLAEWTPIFPPPDAASFSSTLANIASVGFVFGGGCFKGHRVAVTSGTARFDLVEYKIK